MQSAIVIFEDDEANWGDKIAYRLKQAFQEPEIVIEQVNYNYHTATADCLGRFGRNQIWLIDIRSSEMQGPDDEFEPRVQWQWASSLLQSDDKNDPFLQDVKELWLHSELFDHYDDPGDIAGLAVAVEAARKEVPFMFTSRYDGLLGDLPSFLLWGKEGKATGGRCLSKRDLVSENPGKEIDKVLDLAHQHFTRFHVTESFGLFHSSSRLPTDPTWRDLRDCSGLVERLRRVSAPCLGAIVQEGLFNPHHLRGGADIARSEPSSGIYSANCKLLLPRCLFSDDVRVALAELGYDFETALDLEGPITIWQRPPLRALIQEDCVSHPNDFDQALELWGQELKEDLASLEPLQCVILDDNEVFPADTSQFELRYLWFNLPAILNVIGDCAGLRAQASGGWLRSGPDNTLGQQQVAVRFLLFKGAPGWRASSFYGGFVGSLTLKAGHFGSFPALENGQVSRTKWSGKLVRGLLQHGARWVHYSAVARQTGLRQGTLTFVDRNDILIEDIATERYKEAQENYPTLAFFIPAVEQGSSFQIDSGQSVALVARPSKPQLAVFKQEALYYTGLMTQHIVA